jgi:hypothetical protein
MRWVIAVLALGLAGACDEGSATVGGKGGARGSGYTLEVRALDGAQTFIVTAPDGRVVGARAAEGASALMDSARAQALLNDPPPVGADDVPERVAIRLPGFDLSVAADEDDANGDHGRVNLSIGGQQRIVVNADEGGPGDADDRAYVRITGADEDATRDFVNDAEELSGEVKQQMLTELGL